MSSPERLHSLVPSADRQDGIRSVAVPGGMHQTPVRTASAVTDEQADIQQAQPQTSPQGYPGPALPGLWRRAAPQLQATLQEQMADLGGTAQSSRPELAWPASLGLVPGAQPQTSLRDQYALPGQVQRAGGMTDNPVMSSCICTSVHAFCAEVALQSARMF